ncbi:MAG: STAS domain-containing protein [Chitinophagaceae bacterium]
MNVKTDTKEKFHVITIGESSIAANMTAELEHYLVSYLENNVKNVILNCKDIKKMEDAAAETLVKMQQQFYEQNASFIVCCLDPGLEKYLDETGLLELMNTTPTESEAGDIIQMEEIERELMDTDDPQFQLD